MSQTVFNRIQPQFCINAKLRRIHKLLSKKYDEQFRSIGLKGTMVPILFIIGKRKEVNQKTISDLLLLDPSTMSRDIASMKKKGWVKIKSGEDPRADALFLTEKGKALVEKAAVLWEKLHHETKLLLGNYLLQQLDAVHEALSSQTN